MFKERERQGEKSQRRVTTESKSMEPRALIDTHLSIWGTPSVVGPGE